MARHGAAFLEAPADREDVLRREFAEIDVIGAAMEFAECLPLTANNIGILCNANAGYVLPPGGSPGNVSGNTAGNIVGCTP